jgi:general secretion pathway protein D
MRINALLCALALLPAAGFAQLFDFGGGATGPSQPWKEFKLPNKTVKLDFRNANVDMVLSLYQRLSGITIVKDPALTGPITITSAKEVPLDEAFQILSTTLSLKNFDLRKDGNMLVIRQRNSRSNQGGGSGGSNFSPEMISSLMGGMNQRSDLRVYPIKFANAASVARTINEVFQGTQDPFSQLMQQFNSGAFRQPAGAQGNQRRMNFPMGLGGRNNGSAVRASSDDYSNTVIVNAPSDVHQQVADLIDRIDKQTEQPLKPKVFKLEYAAADDLAPVIQNVLTANAPRGRGGQGNTNVPIEQRFQQAFRFGTTQAAFGTVVSEPRTNSLIVTATQDNLDIVGAVIGELDKEVVVESSTFVVPLENARADLVADLLNRAFGSRTGGVNTGMNRNTGTNQNRNTQNRNNNQFRPNTGGGGGNNFGFGGGRSPEEDPNNLYLEMQDPNSMDGDLLTTVEVAQGFQQMFGGGTRQGGAQRTGGQTTDRDAQGRLINVRDLTGQVTIIPDPNTNSLIIVTTPGNQALLQGILEQLDKIPEQVMIETIIVEATLDASSKLGVEWNFIGSRPFGTPGTTGTSGQNFGLNTPGAQGFKFTLTGGTLTAFLNALQTDQKFEVLSTPRIFTSNGSQAQINISQRVPYVVSQREDANGNLTFNYNYQDVGIVLTVTPRITSNGQVTMDISQTANDLQGFTTFNAPIVNQRLADTTVSVKDGETVILGGIIRSTVSSTTNKVPLLGDIPLLGNLFKSTSKTKGKTELLVFLTPRIVRDNDEAQRLREQQQNELSKGTQKVLGDKVPPVSKPGDKKDPPKADDKKSGGN